MNDEEKYEFYKKYKGKKIEFSDDEDFKTIFRRKLAFVTLGDINYSFICEYGDEFKYARARQRRPKFGDKVKAWDDIVKPLMPNDGTYIAHVGGDFPHIVASRHSNFYNLPTAEGVKAFSYKNVEVIDQ